MCSPAATSPFAWPFVDSLCGKTAEEGVGCEDRGPLPGVGGRGDSGGESGGAGIEVPSVREKLMGVSVSGLYLGPAMVQVAVPGTKSGRQLSGPSCNRQQQLMAARYVIVIGDQSQKPQAGGSSGGALERRVRQGFAARLLHDTRRTRRGCGAWRTLQTAQRHPNLPLAVSPPRIRRRHNKYVLTNARACKTATSCISSSKNSAQG